MLHVGVDFKPELLNLFRVFTLLLCWTAERSSWSSMIFSLFSNRARWTTSLEGGRPGAVVKDAFLDRFEHAMGFKFKRKNVSSPLTREDWILWRAFYRARPHEFWILCLEGSVIS